MRISFHIVITTADSRIRRKNKHKLQTAKWRKIRQRKGKRGGGKETFTVVINGG